MPGKRNSRTNQQSTRGTAFAVPAEPSELDVTRPATPVELPVTGDPAALPPAAPKAGPPVRGGRAGGVGRGQSARPARQYAFRRS